ncbi:glucosaminidase [Treponema phagedenis]|uniref:Glucosaminidase n=2 Tax=Treponema phagedenis TaxID=162 RepID=A0AAE6M900_TREPH|nr:glucosaminidase [Treponema phagedenis]QEJ99615.1 glucosaminidase [Treponema phagedenis]QEK02238.1 glucosaminidase [Treponema phagedenis]QEK05170.1 glucosaminidase [Treponema phagedenis]QEK07828.1 glucosaminidase [Treponema phagedenis]
MRRGCFYFSDASKIFHKKTDISRMNKKIIFSVYAVFLLCIFFCFSCKSVPPAVPQYIMGEGKLREKHFIAFFKSQNIPFDAQDLQALAEFYISESRIEGINADVAFAQMCLETGFLQFGGLVTREMNNFCGLGSIGADQPGEVFDSVQLGVRAHIQHLKAYASPAPLVMEVIDPRYKYVNPKGKAPTIYGLTKTWAQDPDYGKKLENLLHRMYKHL